MAVADGVVTFLLQNLSQLVVDEVKLLSGVKSKIESLCQELKFIDIFLKSSEGKRNDPFVKEVVNQIRDVAYKAEDVVDTYITKVTKQKGRSIWKKIFHSKDHTMMLHDVNAEIEKIRRSIDEIYKNKERYSIGEGEFRSGNNEAGESLRKRRRNVEEDYVMHDPSVVLEELKKWRSRRSVVSIIGMGGLGKTTLARKIYNTDQVKEVFPLRAWGYVSDDYRPRELLLSLLMCLTSSTSGYNDLTEEQLKEEVRKYLKGNNYLIVLDDIWRNEVWDDLQDAFPDEPGKGSRILLTSRKKEVASYAEAALAYDLPLLDEEDSWKLFSWKVFRGEEFPSELEPLGRSIIESSGGLPLAIIVLAGLFAKKEKSQREWSRIKDHVNWLLANRDKSKVMDTLKLSYDNLPPRLKPCFLYLGMYPEDYEIPVKQLICLWIAEGFVQVTGYSKPPEPEVIADDYLDELVDLNLVQVASKRSDGGVKTCRIHDLLRELCISESKGDKFLDICTSTSSNPRRLSCQCSKRSCISFTKSYQSCTRSFILFDKTFARYHMISIPERLKLARVLDFGITESMDELHISSAPSGLMTLIHLRYLRMYFTYRDEYTLEDILHFTGCLWNLETLHIRGWRDGKHKISTSGILKFKRLRHLDTDGFLRLQPEHMSGLDNETISDLQTLYSVYLDPKTMSVVNKRFPKLRKLGVVADYPEDGGEFLNLQPLSNLHTLKIYNTIYLPSDACAFLSNLTKITFINCITFQSCFMNTLGQLTNLQVLKLEVLYLPYKKQHEFDINCAAGEFPKLEMFKMEDISVHMWTLERGAMPRLQRLVINSPRTLSELPEELWSLTALGEVNVQWPNPNLANSLQNVEMDPHIPLIPLGVRELIFENARNPGAWVIHLGAHTATYTGPVSTVEGTAAAGPQRRVQTVESIEVSLPLTWYYLQHLAEQGELVIHPPLGQPLQGVAPDLPPEEDPEEFIDEGPQYVVLDDGDDDDSPYEEGEVLDASPDVPHRNGDDHPGLPNGYH